VTIRNGSAPAETGRADRNIKIRKCRTMGGVSQRKAMVVIISLLRECTEAIHPLQMPFIFAVDTDR